MLSKVKYYLELTFIALLMYISVSAYSENISTTFLIKPQFPVNPTSRKDCQNYNNKSYKYLDYLRKKSFCRTRSGEILVNEGSTAMLAYLNTYVPVGSCCTQVGIGKCKLPPSCAPAKEKYYCEKLAIREKVQECYNLVGAKKTNINPKVVTNGAKLLNSVRPPNNGRGLSKSLTARAISESEVRLQDAMNELDKALSGVAGNSVKNTRFTQSPQKRKAAQNNRKVTHATKQYSNGKYVGDFLNGIRTGHGTYYFKNGNRYTGAFQKGKATGKGTFYFKNGDKHVGNFKDSQSHGYGTYYWKDGGTLKGNFINNKIQSGFKYDRYKNKIARYANYKVVENFKKKRELAARVQRERQAQETSRRQQQAQQERYAQEEYERKRRAREERYAREDEEYQRERRRHRARVEASSGQWKSITDTFNAMSNPSYYNQGSSSSSSSTYKSPGYAKCPPGPGSCSIKN